MSKIYEYTDYLIFINERWDELKNSSPHFSLEYVVRKLDFSSKSHLSMILNGKRYPSEENILRFKELYQLHKEEVQFFKYLILKKKYQKEVELSSLIESKLTSLKEIKRETISQHSMASVFKEWYTILCRDMIHLKDFIYNPQDIAQKIGNVSPDQIKRCYHKLIDNGWISINENGTLTTSHPSLTTKDDKDSESIKSFHTSMLERITKKIPQTSVDQRYISCLSLTADASRIEEIKKEIRSFEDGFVKKFENKEEATELMTLSIQCMPQASSRRNGDTPI